jgi:hypothetical protein
MLDIRFERGLKECLQMNGAAAGETTLTARMLHFTVCDFDLPPLLAYVQHRAAIGAHVKVASEQRQCPMFVQSFVKSRARSLNRESDSVKLP